MEKSKEHIRHCLLYEYQLQHSESEATRNICQAIGQGSISHGTASNWFKEFRKKNYRLEDKPRSGRPSEVDLNDLKARIERDPRQTTRCLASILGCTHTTIENHLKQFGLVAKLGVWVPHDLSQLHQKQRLDICMNLLSFRRTPDWLNHLVTGDEKWVLYINCRRKYQWLSPNQQPVPTPKPEIRQKKVMLSVWWDVHGIVYWTLLPTNTTITADVYCEQLENLRANLSAKRPQHDKIYFQYDNARPHIAKSVCKKLLEYGWELLPHPPYSPDLAPTDYHLFRSLSNDLREKIFEEETDLENYLATFFDSKPKELYAKGIHDLTERWQEVIDNDGQYIID